MMAGIAAKVAGTAAAAMLAPGGFAGQALAQIVSNDVTYEIEGQPFQGFFARNAGFPGERPLVIIIHDWDGLGDYEKQRARMLAELGYAAFAVDLYGQGVRPDREEDKKARSGELYKDRVAMRRRLGKGLEVGRQQPGVSKAPAVAMGYCFGGAAVLEWARTGDKLAGFVAFHGTLDTPPDQSWQGVAAPVLILHGTNDPYAPMGQVAELTTAMDAAGVNYRMELYGGAKHAFTVWGTPATDALGYDPAADLESWKETLGFLEEVLD